MDNCRIEVEIEGVWIDSAINGRKEQKYNSELAKYAAIGYSAETKRNTRVVANGNVLYQFRG